MLHTIIHVLVKVHYFIYKLFIVIANYPLFTEIQVDHKKEIDTICKNFLPYCDFIFSTLYMWEVGKFKTQLSLLNGNLVIKTKNIIGHQIEVSLLGHNDLDKTIEVLLSDYKLITLFPEQMLKHINNINKLDIVEDIDNQDYILSTRDISELDRKTFLGKKRRISRFLKENYTYQIKLIDKSDKNILREILFSVCDKWAASKNDRQLYNIKSEMIALENFINICHILNVEIWGLEINGHMRAFNTIEYLGNEYALSSFAKADLTYPDLNSYITYKTTEYIYKEKNIKYINHEQDLGLVNLRKEKLSWRPVALLKKYTIKKKL
jgi:hypothetical protein